MTSSKVLSSDSSVIDSKSSTLGQTKSFSNIEEQLFNTSLLRLWRTGAEAKQLDPHEDLEVDVRNLARQINGLSSIF